MGAFQDDLYLIVSVWFHLSVLFFQPNPSYTYSYQVAADETQTYIAHNENRKDGAVTGEYSYVDPYGTLITVT